MNTSTANVTAGCSPLDLSTVTHYSLIPSVLILATFAILHGRRAKCGRLGWRPGMVVPINFLNGYKNRWAYAAGFGAISNRVLMLITNRDGYWGDDIEVPDWAKNTFLFLLATIETSIVFYPLFACLTSPFKLVGSILGATYSIFWCIIQIIYMLDCPYPVDGYFSSVGIGYSDLILEWPSALFLLILVGTFMYMLWICISTREFVVRERDELGLPHHIIYVKKLLKGELPPKIINSFHEGFIDAVKYKTVPGFLYPSRLLCVMFVVSSFSYQLLIELVIVVGITTDRASNLIGSIPLFYGQRAKDFLEGWTIAVVVSYWVTLVLVALLVVGNSLLIFKNYRRNILQLCRGDKGFVPQLNMTSVELMAASMRWSAYQIAYSLWGMLIFALTVFLLLIGIATLFTVYIYFTSWDGVWYLLIWLGPPLLMSLILFYVQLLLTRMFFVQPPAEPKQPLPLAIDNRKWFETAYYLTFFINIAIGLVSSFIRLLWSLVIGLITLSRMDEPVLKRGYERFDKGHLAYIGVLFVEYTHNHPVLRVFCNELVKLRDDSLAAAPREAETLNSARVKGSLSSKATWRWHLAYTLIRNPDILLSRKYNLAKLPQFTEIYVNSEQLSEQNTAL